jgi:hypothetical protein
VQTTVAQEAVFDGMSLADCPAASSPFASLDYLVEFLSRKVLLAVRAISANGVVVDNNFHVGRGEDLFWQQIFARVVLDNHFFLHDCLL